MIEWCKELCEEGETVPEAAVIHECGSWSLPQMHGCCLVCGHLTPRVRQPVRTCSILNPTRPPLVNPPGEVFELGDQHPECFGRRPPVRCQTVLLDQRRSVVSQSVTRCFTPGRVAQKPWFCRPQPAWFRRLIASSLVMSHSPPCRVVVVDRLRSEALARLALVSMPSVHSPS